MAEIQENIEAGSSAQPFRIDQKLHQILYKSEAAPKLEPMPQEVLPEPVYPQKPDPVPMTRKEYQKFNAIRTLKSWGSPYFKSRWHSNTLRPIIPYLFTAWKCHLDCHYCWSYNNAVKGMTEDVAKRSIDWLHSIGSRVLALMGGEPLLRPKFIHKIVDYSAKRDIFVYLPTNGRLMKPDVIDRLGDAGIGTINLAVDCIDEKPGLAKALTPIRPYFEYAIKNMKKYSFSLFFNVCITRTNLDDVKALTELAHDYDIGIDYHIVESPLIDAPHFKHADENSTFLTPEDYPKVDALVDWIVDKHKQGYKI